LAAALDASDAAGTALLAHSLKGNAGVVGATTAVARARDLEHAARAGETARFPACRQALDEALDAALAGFAAKGHQPAAP
nr:Hpt domain-containing protein [Solidesulfovibrio magneticus]